MEYYHVDVFSKNKLAGNGLTVFLLDHELQSDHMQKLAQEFKQFETIFLLKGLDDSFRARIFTVEEELDFAGHPILGAAAVLHDRFFEKQKQVEIIFKLNQKEVIVGSEKQGNSYCCQMNQGKPEFLGLLAKEQYDEYLQPLSLTKENLAEGYPLEVVSTGLPYLLVPIKSGLENVKIVTSDLEKRLEKISAKFVYIFDVNQMEGRTWDNFGNVEDVATGSAAGPVGAYLYEHGMKDRSENIVLHQGRYVGRPSEITVFNKQNNQDIIVQGDVSILVKGEY